MPCRPLLSAFFASVMVASSLIGGALAVAQTTTLREFANRQEGTTLRPNNLPDLELVALHRQFGPYTSPANLKIRFFVPAGGANLLCEARELRNFSHYYMRSKGSYAWTPEGWNVFEPWPTADVIDTLAIPWSNIGVLSSFVDSNGTRVYAPADVYTGAAPESKDTYTLYISTGRDIQTLTTFIRNDAGQVVGKTTQVGCSRAANPNCRLFSNDTTQAVDVSFATLPRGLYRIGLEATVPRTTDTMALNVSIFHAR